MKFNNHRNLEGCHAAFSPSSPSWLRYNDEKITRVFINKKAAERGTRLHAWAKETIDLGIKQPRSKKTLYAFVNDAIGFQMSTEVVLYFSDYFFGTADAISFRNNILRISDLKTGESPVHREQLIVYAALFCLEYRISPENIEEIILRIYQSDAIDEFSPEPSEVRAVMDLIIHDNEVVSGVEEER